MREWKLEYVIENMMCLRITYIARNVISQVGRTGCDIRRLISGMHCVNNLNLRLYNGGGNKP